MSTDSAISYNATCAGCGYNLRGLKTDGQCPECGREIRESLKKHYEYRREQMKAIEEVVGVNEAGVQFVLDSLRNSIVLNKSATGGVTARMICAAFVNWARVYFNGNAEEARKCLSIWGIRSSDDVGRVIFALFEAGILRRKPSGATEDFADLFDLAGLFTKEL